MRCHYCSFDLSLDAEARLTCQPCGDISYIGNERKLVSGWIEIGGYSIRIGYDEELGRNITIYKLLGKSGSDSDLQFEADTMRLSLDEIKHKVKTLIVFS